MRLLSAEEMELVAGGTDTTPVSNDPGSITYYNTGGDPPPSYTGPFPGSGGSAGDGSGYGSGDGSGGGGLGGAGGVGANGPGHDYQTAGGHDFRYHGNLTAHQLSIASKIIDYGAAHQRTGTDIRIAIDQAFYESSLGDHMTQASGNHKGLFQYDDSTWSYLGHGNMNINSDDDQITAMFQDLTTLGQRYTAAHSSGQIPWSLGWEEYVEIKHHLGPNYPTPGDANSMSVVSAYDVVANGLGVDSE